MVTVTVSPKYKVVIPKDMRRQLDLKHGQKLQILNYGDKIEFVPIKNVKALKGFLKGIDTIIEREEDAAIQAASVMQQASVVDITSSISMSAEFSYELKIPMSDRLILATARAYNAALWTRKQNHLTSTDIMLMKQKERRSCHIL